MDQKHLEKSFDRYSFPPENVKAQSQFTLYVNWDNKTSHVGADYITCKHRVQLDYHKRMEVRMLRIPNCANACRAIGSTGPNFVRPDRNFVGSAFFTREIKGFILSARALGR